MKRFFVSFAIIMVLVFVVSCGSSKKTGDETDSGENMTDEDSVDTDSSDTEPMDENDTSDTTYSNCGNKVTDAGEICDGGTQECSAIDANYTDGYATCKADCSGWDTKGCTKDSTDSADADTDHTDTNPDTDTGDTAPAPVNISFERIIADDDPYGPAFVTVDDLDNDGNKDMIVSQDVPFMTNSPEMKGRIDIYWGTGKLDKDSWNRVEVNIGSDIYFPHQVKVADLNNDGKKDLIIPAGGSKGLLGSQGVLFWLENKDGGKSNTWERHDITEFDDGHFFFDVTLADLDRDGITDIVTNASKNDGEQDEILMWFKGTDSPERFDTTPRIIGDRVGGPFPRVMDLNNDGKLDIVVAQLYNDDTATNGSFLWFEQPSSIEHEWPRHIIDRESGPGFMLEIIDDLYGDGVTRAVGVNHVNSSDDPNGPQEGVFIFDIPEDPTLLWPKKNIAAGIKSRKSSIIAPLAAPGLLGYGDITGNGLLDFVVSGDGDSRVFWFEQKTAGNFVQHKLDGDAGASINDKNSFGQAGGMKIVDLDGDGSSEIIVTLLESNKIYIYQVKK